TMDRLTPIPPYHDTALFDSERMRGAIAVLMEQNPAHSTSFRNALTQALKAEMMRGRAEAERRLLLDRHGQRCAEGLCYIQDEIIRLLFEVSVKYIHTSPVPSEAERMAVVATGGYGRGLMAPGSDTDLLFLLPYKQTAWGESVAETILYCLWDMGLK